MTDFSLEWHNKENTGNKLQRIFTGADALVGWAKVLRRDLLKTVANFIGVISFFIFTDYKFVVLIVIYTALFLFIEFTISKKVFELSNRFNKLNQSAGGVYMETANNMLSIKALGGEKGAISRVADREKLSKDILIKKSRTNNKKWRLMQTLNGISLGIFLLLMGQAVLDGTMTVGMILVFFTYFFTKLQGSMSDVSDIHSDLIDLRSDMSNMMPIFRETEFVKTGNESFPKDWDKIELKNVSMEYASGQKGMDGLDFVIRKNEKVGIAGLSGGGKSTLAKVILGLYGIKSGSFKIGNKDYYSISHNETLSNITVVLQETELFNLSMRDNITMMRPEDPELLQKAIGISMLDAVIERLPEGLDSKIGEKGYMLSGGERQRLGIARAIYKNAPIIILDEATSSLDSETEGKIMEKLLGGYGQDKTFIIIAHRLGTLRYTDRIAVMENGKNIEEGTYEELMRKSTSVFYRLNKKMVK